MTSDERYATPRVSRSVRWVRDRAFVIGPLLTVGVCVVLVVGVWKIGGGLARESALFCGNTNQRGTTVSLPAEPLQLDEFKALLTDANPCASFAVELTVTGDYPAQTVLAPMDRSVTFTKNEAIPVRVEASITDFLSECGDHTGRRAGNFPSFSAGDPSGCDPAIETRCRSASGALGLCPALDAAQRCVTVDGHISLRCGSNPTSCVDDAGHFVSCDG